MKDHLSERMIDAARRAHERGSVPATSGSFSARLSDDVILITATGRHKGRLRRADMIMIDLDGAVLGRADGATGARPSRETHLHLSIYRRYRNVGAVFHTHGLAATALTLDAGDHLVLEGYELLKAFDGVRSHETRLEIPIFENSQDMSELVGAIDPWLGDHPRAAPAYAIRGHGTMVWGATLESCERHEEALDFLLRCELARRPRL